MSQYDLLVQNISKLSPQVQKIAFDALRTGKYASVNVYAKQNGGEYQQAKIYMDQFFNTPEGRRFGGRQVGVLPDESGTGKGIYNPLGSAYNQTFNQQGRTNVVNVGLSKDLNSTKRVSISDEKAARLGIDNAMRKTLTKGQLTQIEINSGQYNVRNGNTFLKPEVRQQIQAGQFSSANKNYFQNIINENKSYLISTKQGVVDTRTGKIVQKVPFINSTNIQSILSREINKIRSAFRTPASAFRTAEQLTRTLLVPVKYVPTVFIDYGKTLLKGTVKIGLYVMDEAGYISQIRFNPKTKQLYVPNNVKYISQDPRLANAKKWLNYSFKTNPLLDPDYQNVGITLMFIALGAYSFGTAQKAFGVVKGKAIWDAIKDPSPYNIAVVYSLFLPETAGRLKKLRAREDILVAKTGELVPLKERITQVDDIIKNSGKKIETITGKASSKARFTNVKNVKNVDYSFGNEIEFATYKVGSAYPTSEIFPARGNKLGGLIKTGRINIEETIVGRANRIYGKYIRETLLKKGKMSEAFIKKYYNALKAEANRIKKPVLGISPKRLRGFAQAEHESIKVLPDNYKPKTLRFAGWTKEGFRVYTDKPYSKNLKSFVKSKFTKGKIERSYTKQLAKEKLEYLKGRPAIKGEYAEHGKAHLTAQNLDPKAQRYAQKLNVKQFGNIFLQHDLAKVSDIESFTQFEHGKVLYDLWRKGQYPDKNIYKLPKKIQRQIAEAYSGHTPVKPRLIDTLRKGWKDNSVTADLLWYLRNRRNPYLQDILTLDRLELPRAGRWNLKVKYNLLDKRALRRIYGSELEAVKNIRFLDWKSVPSRLKRQLGIKGIREIKLRDSKILRNLKALAKKGAVIPRLLKGSRTTKYIPSVKRSARRIPVKRYATRYPIKKISPSKIPYKTSAYKSYKTKNYRLSYKKGYSEGYKARYSRPSNYNPNYNKKYQSAYARGYSDAYKGNYKINYKTGKYVIKKGYKPIKPTKYSPKFPPRRPRAITSKPPKIFAPQGFKAKKLSTKQDSYYVVMKRKGKLVKLTARPLILKDAKDYLAYRIDNGLSRTAFFVPIGRTNNVVGLPFQMRGYFNRISHKLRPYRIRAGKKRAILRGYIEKKRYSLDTRTEKREIKASKRKGRITHLRRKVSPRPLKMRKKGIRKVSRTPIRRVSSTRRRQLILQLRKARKVRIDNLKRSSPRRVRHTTKSKKRTISPAQRRILLKRLAKARRVLARKRKKK